MATQSRLPAFLLTRPAAQSQRFVGQLCQRFGVDLDITISPLLTPRFLDAPFPAGHFDALIFTSETGVAAFQALTYRPNSLPKRAYCVGNRTAKAAVSAGLEPISADGNATSLIDLIHQDAPTALLHISGAHSRGEVAQNLTETGIKTDVCVLYEQAPLPLTQAAVTLLQGEGPVLVPLFSPRSAALFCEQISKLGPFAPLTYIALSQAVGAELADLRGAKLCYADRPTAASMIEAIAANCGMV